jgi:23S rRNA (guanine2445-N2)-methyltransferase / 23S rRNA (guanine2069-N7)-methyltransferase
VSAAPLRFLASAPRGLTDLLVHELVACGACEPRERATGVAFSGTLESAYRACLWSRLANRVFLEIAQFEAPDVAEFDAAVRRIDWTAHLRPGATLACDFTGRHPVITHSHFGALKLKDGIVDQLRAATGTRPDVATTRPDVRVHAHAHGPRITLALDLSGESLHRRGYRGAAGEAPLKENVAAGVLLRTGWESLARPSAPGDTLAWEGAEFLDPLCGSGTLVIEAALIALDRAPGLSRDYFGFLGWRGHDGPLWQRLLEEARSRASAGEATPVMLRGRDRATEAIAAARANAARAGVAARVEFEVGPLREAAPLGEVSSSRPGLVCTNPPYGVRLEDEAAARAVHRELGAVLRERFAGWTAAVLTGAPALGFELGLRAYRTHTLWNGALECRLLRIKVGADSERAPGTLGKGLSSLKDTAGARMFANRLAKNQKRLRAWARRSGVSCYRVYDADMPEYAFAIDLYRTLEPEEDWLHVQEYAAPAEIEAESVRRRRGEVLSTLPEVTGVAPERIRVRTRRRTRRGEQYEKLSERERFHVIAEGELHFRVNFDDYLDTGLFLDERLTRARLRLASRGKRFLNLFAYTGSATVYAAAGGALESTSVDLSRTYLDWAHENLRLNGLAGPAHSLVQADCRAWLAEAARSSRRFDLVFLAPPTFSNSKRMEGVLDLERDHPELIDACARLLAPGGLLVFSTNARRFRLAETLSERYDISNVSAATLPEDFARNPRIHLCFEVRARTAGAAQREASAAEGRG